MLGLEDDLRFCFFYFQGGIGDGLLFRQASQFCIPRGLFLGKLGLGRFAFCLAFCLAGFSSCRGCLARGSAFDHGRVVVGRSSAELFQRGLSCSRRIFEPIV